MVRRRIQQLETQIAEMDGIIENLKVQREDLDKKSSLKETQIARVKQIISVKEIQGVRVAVIRGLKVEKMMRTSLLSFSEKIGQLFREENEKVKEENLLLREAINMREVLKPIIRLIVASYDISSIVGVNFKKQYEGYQHLFDAAFNDMLDTNSLAWIYKFLKNNNESLSEENMHNLVTNAIKTNIPAYMYLMAIKIDNISDKEMERLIAAIVASNDRKYIDYLVLDLSKKGVSKVVRDYIKSLGITVSPENIFDYDNNLANELEKVLLEDNLEVLYKHGMYSYEDRAYVLSNIQAGL